MANQGADSPVFDLSGALDDLFDFEREIDALTGVSVPRAADAMASAFEAAGDRIEKALSGAARSGKLDFETLVGGILSDLARLASQGLLDQVSGGRASGSGGSSQGQAVSVSLNLAAGQDARSITAAQGQIASAIARAVQSGGRWS